MPSLARLLPQITAMTASALKGDPGSRSELNSFADIVWMSMDGHEDKNQDYRFQSA